MKTIAIVSSKSLSEALRCMDVNNIVATEIEKDAIYFHEGGARRPFLLRVVTRQIYFHLTDDNLRWDWIKKLVDFMEEQPILLIFTPSSVNLATQY